MTVSGYNRFPSGTYPVGTIYDSLTVSGHFQIINSEIRNFSTTGNTFVNNSRIGNLSSSAGNFFAMDSSIASLVLFNGSNILLNNTDIQNLDFRGYFMYLTNSTIRAGRVESAFGSLLTYSTINSESLTILSGVEIRDNVVITGRNLTIWGVNYGPCEVEVLGGRTVRRTTCPGGRLGFDPAGVAEYMR